MNFLVKPVVPVMALFGAAAAAQCSLITCSPLSCNLSGQCTLNCQLTGPAQSAS
jgi:hypothetical protein